jgi:cytochrome c-type biogenesis protein CcmH
MTSLALALLLAISAAPAQTGTPPTPVGAAGAPTREMELDRQVRAVSSQLRCVVCQGLSIQDSPSALAQEMRGVVREQLAAGRSPEQVKAYFVDRYGEWVLLRPAPRGLNLLVYVLPVAVLLGGGVFVYLKARSWTRPAAS